MKVLFTAKEARRIACQSNTCPDIHNYEYVYEEGLEEFLTEVNICAQFGLRETIVPTDLFMDENAELEFRSRLTEKMKVLGFEFKWGSEVTYIGWKGAQ